MQVTVHEAKTNLSKLIAAVERGEEVVIARRDKPVVRLVLEKPVRPKRVLGALAGTMSDEVVDFLTKNPELDREIEKDFLDAVAANKPYRPSADKS
jgi:antitoxin (DNA-binding transcriptional repressor) of toxin-antitoxin stability system